MMIKSKRWFAVLAAVAVLLGAGCASQRAADVYSRDSALRAQNVDIATVEYVRPVVIEGTKTPIGPAAGGAVGAVAAGTVGDGTGRALMRIVGAVAGSIVGAFAEEAVTRREGVEVTVKLVETGQILAVVQEEDPNVEFRIGDRVRLLREGGYARVSY